METLKSKVSNLVESAGDMSSLFGNPFATPVGQKIEQATEATLASENWQLNMEICDMINSSEDVAKDAVRAMKKRLQQVKNYTVIMYTLTVLETCVKNCDKRFHFMLFHNKDFTNELVKIIGPKNDPPTVVTEKVLGLIQSWADTFKQPEYQGVVSVYEDLKCKGIEFPMTDLDSMAPILTPKRTVATVPTPPASTVGSTVTVAVPRVQQPSQEEPILHPVNLGQSQLVLTPEQSAKLKRDIGQVQGNMAVFSEMLSDLKHNENPEDVKFLEDLHKACKEMQRRIAILLCTISSEDELMTDMLHVNDELNNLFLRYGRFRKNVEKTNPKSDEPSLIDFDAGASAVDSKKPSGAIPKKLKDEDKEFDMLARSRNEGGSSKSSGAPATKLPDFGDANPAHSSLREAAFQPKNLEIDESEFDDILQSHTESDFNEMEQWLSTGSMSSRLSSAGASGEVLSSSEFDKFLAERAAAAAAKDQKKPDEK